jgi:uncharacterized protein with von Willebrand factor type A (vWA) domain
MTFDSSPGGKDAPSEGPLPYSWTPGGRGTWQPGQNPWTGQAGGGWQPPARTKKSRTHFDSARWVGFSAYEPITNGSQVLAHDGYDVQHAEIDMDPQYTALGKKIAAATKRLRTAPALGNDLYWSFAQRAPRIDPLVPLTGAYEPHQQVIEEIMGTKEWQEIHANTGGDGYLAGMAVAGVLDKAVGALSDEATERMNRLAELGKQFTDAQEQADFLEELATLRPAHAADLKRRAEEERQKALTLEQELAGLRIPLTPDELDALRQAMRGGMQAVAGQIKASAAAFSMFSTMMNVNGPGLGTLGNSSGLTTEQKLALATKLAHMPKLQAIVEMAGRMMPIAAYAQATRTNLYQSEVTEINQGRDISRLLPTELATLAPGHPELERLFYLKFATENLFQYELDSKEPEGRGPIIVAVDNSGSMSGDPEVWSKAATLALLRIANVQHRDVIVLHFTTAVDREDRFEHKTGANLDKMLATLEYFSGGGTAFEPWMERALKLIEESMFNYADVICITDGLAMVPQSYIDNWNRTRKDKSMRAYTILISNYDYPADNQTVRQMVEITDRFMTLKVGDTNMANDEDLSALNTIFSV